MHTLAKKQDEEYKAMQAELNGLERKGEKLKKASRAAG